MYIFKMVAAGVMAADYDIVLTTFDVLSKEWAVASPSNGSARWYELHGTAGRGSQSWRFSPSDYKGVNAQTLVLSKLALLVPHTPVAYGC